jgi:hypothetical protein
MYSRPFPNLLLASGLDGSLGTMAGVKWLFPKRRCSSGMMTLDFMLDSGRGIGSRLLLVEQLPPLYLQFFFLAFPLEILLNVAELP